METCSSLRDILLVSSGTICYADCRSAADSAHFKHPSIEVFLRHELVDEEIIEFHNPDNSECLLKKGSISSWWNTAIERVTVFRWSPTRPRRSLGVIDKCLAGLDDCESEKLLRLH